MGLPLLPRQSESILQLPLHEPAAGVEVVVLFVVVFPAAGVGVGVGVGVAKADAAKMVKLSASVQLAELVDLQANV